MEANIEKNKIILRLLLHKNNIFDTLGSDDIGLDIIIKNILFDEKNINNFTILKDYDPDIFIDLDYTQINILESLLNNNKEKIAKEFLKSNITNTNNKIKEIKITDLLKNGYRSDIFLKIYFEKNILKEKVYNVCNKYHKEISEKIELDNNYDIKLNYSSNICLILRSQSKENFKNMKSFLSEIKNSQIFIENKKNTNYIEIKKYRIQEEIDNG